MHLSKSPSILVLRLNHRIKRDKRLSTHVGLTARAFGASGFIYTGEQDKIGLENSLHGIKNDWGGRFKVYYWEDWIQPFYLLQASGSVVIVHLTMYGERVSLVQKKIYDMYNEQKKTVIIVVGGAKVPSEIYKLSDFNISVTNQPHSEVAALAVAMDRIFPSALDMSFPSAKFHINPSKNGGRGGLSRNKR